MSVKEKFFLALILLFSLFSRLWQLSQPLAYLFDEQYHVSAAKFSLHNDPRLYQWWQTANEEGVYADWLHPPLFKYLQAMFMAIGGENSAAWRLPNVLLGVGVIYLVFVLAQELFGQKKLALLAAGLASLDGLLLVQSRVGMNDMLLTFWALIIAWRYLIYVKKSQLKFRQKGLSLFWLGCYLGLALATKWTGLFFLVFILSREVYLLFKQRAWPQLPWLFFSLVVIPGLIYVLSFGQLFLQGKSLAYVAELHRQIFWYQTHRDNLHPDQSKPWQWFFNQQPVTYWQAKIQQPPVLQPQILTSRRATNAKKLAPGIYAFANPVLNWLGVLSVVAMVSSLIVGLGQSKILALKQQLQVLSPKRLKQKLSLKQAEILLLSFYFLSWLPWIFSPRIMFYYHYTPAVPFLMIIVAEQITAGMKKITDSVLPAMQKRRLKLFLLSFLLSAIVIAFGFYYPFWTGITGR